MVQTDGWARRVGAYEKRFSTEAESVTESRNSTYCWMTLNMLLAAEMGSAYLQCNGGDVHRKPLYITVGSRGVAYGISTQKRSAWTRVRRRAQRERTSDLAMGNTTDGIKRAYIQCVELDPKG